MLDLIDPLRIRDHQNRFEDLRIWLEEISGNKSILVLYDHDSNIETKNRRLWSSLSVLFFCQSQNNELFFFQLYTTCVFLAFLLRVVFILPIITTLCKASDCYGITSAQQITTLAPVPIRGRPFCGKIIIQIICNQAKEMNKFVFQRDLR